MIGWLLSVPSSQPTLEAQRNMETAEKMGEYINRYGFMTMFSAIILIAIVIICLVYVKKYAERSKIEAEISSEERKASIEQNNKMFDLVTKVQTEQVVQLQEMTESLRNMNMTIHDTEKKLETVSDNFTLIRNSMLDCSENHQHIRTTLEQLMIAINDCKSENHEIVSKLNAIEIELAKSMAIQTIQEEQLQRQ